MEDLVCIHEVAARHSLQIRLCPLRAGLTLQITCSWCTREPHTFLRLRSTSRHPKDTPSVLQLRPRRPLRAVRLFFFDTSKVTQGKQCSNGPNRGPSTPSVPPISAPSSLTRYQGASTFSLWRQSTREDGDIDKFPAVVERIGEEDERKSKVSSNEVSMDDMPLHHRRLTVLLISREPLSSTAAHCRDGYIDALVISGVFLKHILKLKSTVPPPFTRHT